MRELRVHIERIVRPIGASPRRRLRMREELLGHLTALVEETGSLEQALERFGDPEEIRRGLQSSVPWHERLAHTPLISDRWRVFQGWDHPRPTETAVRHALRVTTVYTLLGFVPCALLVFVLIPLGLALIEGHMALRDTLVRFLGFGLPMLLFLAPAGFCCLLFGHSVVRWHRGGVGAPSVIGVTGRGLLLGAALFALGVLFTWVEAFLSQEIWAADQLLLIGAIAGVAPLVGTWLALRAHEEGRVFHDWKSLKIEE